MRGRGLGYVIVAGLALTLLLTPACTRIREALFPTEPSSEPVWIVDGVGDRAWETIPDVRAWKVLAVFGRSDGSVVVELNWTLRAVIDSGDGILQAREITVTPSPVLDTPGFAADIMAGVPEAKSVLVRGPEGETVRTYTREQARRGQLRYPSPAVPFSGPCAAKVYYDGGYADLDRSAYGHSLDPRFFDEHPDLARGMLIPAGHRLPDRDVYSVVFADGSTFTVVNRPDGSVEATITRS